MVPEEEEIVGFVVSCLAPLETFMSGHDDGITPVSAGNGPTLTTASSADDNDPPRSEAMTMSKGGEAHSLRDLEPMGFGAKSQAVNIGLLVSGGMKCQKLRENGLSLLIIGPKIRR